MVVVQSQAIRYGWKILWTQGLSLFTMAFHEARKLHLQSHTLIFSLAFTTNLNS